MNQAFILQLGLKIYKFNIEAQKIEGTTLKTYEMIVFIFSVLDKDSKERFLKESFLLADINPDVMLGTYLIMSNIDVDFQT